MKRNVSALALGLAAQQANADPRNSSGTRLKQLRVVGPTGDPVLHSFAVAADGQSVRAFADEDGRVTGPDLFDTDVIVVRAAGYEEGEYRVQDLTQWAVDGVATVEMSHAVMHVASYTFSDQELGPN